MASRTILSRVAQTALPLSGVLVFATVAAAAGTDAAGERALLDPSEPGVRENAAGVNHEPARSLAVDGARALLDSAAAAEQAVASTPSGETTAATADDQLRRMAEEAVRTSAYLGVFDYVSIDVNSGRVWLHGSVEHRQRGDRAAAQIAALPGVVEIVNEIEVQSSAPADVQLRRRLFERFYYGGGIPRDQRPEWPVRILVSDARVTLAGELPKSADLARLETMAWEAGASFVEAQLHGQCAPERQAADDY